MIRVMYSRPAAIIELEIIFWLMQTLTPSIFFAVHAINLFRLRAHHYLFLTE